MRAIVPQPRPRAPWRALTLAGTLGCALVAPGPPSPVPLDSSVLAPEGASDMVLLSWKEAARRVEESRGERVGSQVVVPIPPELRHYDDRRRFLAVQAAETREQAYPVPQDDADLAALAGQGELVEMEPVGESYVLYGVGAHASSDPFAHYDRMSGLEIPLYADYLAFEHGDQAFDQAVHEALGRRERLQAERRLARRSASRRKALGVEMASLQRTADGLIRVQERAASLYEDYSQRRQLAGKLHLLEEAARDLGPQP
ncbi:MAG TPA: hypothetical protein VF310_13525, partial [Vicinamibacteria bacterium]